MGSQGYASLLGISASNPVDAQFEFITDSLQKLGAILETGGIRGTRSHPVERTRTGNYQVRGQLVLEPSPEELALLLPWILGAAASGTTYALAETVPERYITIDRIAKVFTYAGVKVDRATFSAREGEILRLSLDLVGKTETVANAGTFPALTIGATAPFIFTDGAFTMQASARSVKDVEIVIDNRLEVQFNNSTTASFIDATDRMVSVNVSTPYTSSETDLYAQALAGAAGSFVFTNGGYSLTFAFAKLQVADQSPVVAGKQEIPLRMAMVARKSATTNELIVTLDSTP